MTERWRRALGRLDREDPDEQALRARADGGPRMPEPSASTGSRVVAAVVALLLAIGGTTLAVRAFRSDGAGSPASRIDPAAVCNFTPRHGPEYVSLDGHEILQSVLDEPGVHFTDLPSDLALPLKVFILAGGIDAANPPEDGWRAIDRDADGATLAAPNGKDWYVARIGTSQGASKVGGWAPFAQVLPTAADRGAGLRLTWEGTTEVQQGDHAQFHLEAVNDGTTAWRDDRGEYWALVHVFDPATGRDLFPNAVYGIDGVGREYDVPPGGRFDVPVATPRIDSLSPGTYGLVACSPDLSLVSPVSELHVLGDTSSTPTASQSSPDVSILVAKPQNESMDALGSGTLAVVDGCLSLGGVTEPGSTFVEPPTFVVWPAGYGLTSRDGVTSVTDEAGTPVADVGSQVRLGGGYVNLAMAREIVDSEIPAPCQVSGERYFVAGQVMDTGQLSVPLVRVGVSNRLGFTLLMPRSWSEQDVDGFDGRTTTQGVAVSSVPLPKPSGQEILPDLSALPPGEVVLAILNTEGGASQAPGPETPLPLRWEDLQAIPNDAGFTSTQDFTLGGTNFVLLIGGATDGVTLHEDDLRRVVTSIGPTVRY